MNFEELNLCEHEDVNSCYRVFKNGTKHYGMQCIKCGKWIPKKQCDFDTLPVVLFDEDMQRNIFQEASDQRLNEITTKRDEESRQWWQKYDEYLDSEMWKKKRKVILERDKGICQGCLSRAAVHVHHLTYEHVFNELAFELVSLCKICHDKAHAKTGNCKVDLSRIIEE